MEYVDSIKDSVRWLGFDWEDRMFYASDYFGQLYDWAEQLIQAGKAYVCDLNGDQMREYRGTLTSPGKNSPYRDRPSARTSTCSAACAPASSLTDRARCEPRSTWPRPT